MFLLLLKLKPLSSCCLPLRARRDLAVASVECRANKAIMPISSCHFHQMEATLAGWFAG